MAGSGPRRARAEPISGRLPTLALLALAVLLPSRSVAQDLNRALRDLKHAESDIQQLQKSKLERSRLRSPTHVEERLTDGELFLRLQDYVRASVIFTDIVENYPKHSATPDALFLLAESLVKAGDYLGARGRYRTILERADESAYRSHVQRALGRLIEIAIHIQDFEGVDEYFTRLSRLPPSEVEAATNYFRAKYLYSVAIRAAEDAKGKVDATKIDQTSLDQARVAFESVNERSPYFSQARYFIGVIATLRAQLGPAVEAFARVGKVAAQTEEQRKVGQLAQLAVGRLNYERDQLDAAIEAYQAVPRGSVFFDTALYEIAWVYIRQGDSTRAERALEVLSVAAPESKHIPDAKLLRGNLLLRDGHLPGASQVFGEVSTQFGPVRDELDRVLREHEDALSYFRQLVRDNLELFDAAAFLPRSAQRWADTEGEMQRAMTALSDLSQARQLVGETEDIVTRLSAAISSPKSVSVFADLRGQRERTTAVRNRLSRVRKTLIALDAKATKTFGSAELEQTRASRRDLERSLGGAATEQQELAQRSLRVIKSFTNVSKDLSKLEVDLLGMEARIAATERFVDDTMKGRDAQAVDTVRAELATQKAAVAEYRRRIRELAVGAEAGRLQVGVGDQDAQREAELRKQHAALVERERQILKALGAKPDPAVENGFRKLASLEAAVDLMDHDIDVIVAERVREMRTVLAEETLKLTGYRERLAALQTESEVVVGGIALDNFKAVRQRFYDLVLRADVGVIDTAWAMREEHRMRAEMLSRERARDLKALEDEYRDITDQGDKQREATP